MAFFAIVNYHATAQADSNSLKTKDYYLQKSKSQKTAAWVLIGVGGAAVIAGTIVAASLEEEDDFDEGINKAAAGGGLLVGGGITCLVSIPLFIRPEKMSAKQCRCHQDFNKFLCLQMD